MVISWNLHGQAYKLIGIFFHPDNLQAKNLFSQTYTSIEKKKKRVMETLLKMWKNVCILKILLKKYAIKEGLPRKIFYNWEEWRPDQESNLTTLSGNL